MNRSRILNRPLRPEWLDISLRLARASSDGRAGRELLNVALRDAPLAEEARKKTVEAIHPVWLNPPSETANLIRWGIEHSGQATDLRPLHLVALIATYPFFGDVCAAVGRSLRLENSVTNADLRNRLHGRLGDREVVDVAARKCIQTLRAFDVLTGQARSGESTQGDQLLLPESFAAWAVHALILSRNTDAIDGTEAESAPEFFFFLRLSTGNVAGYPYLDRFAISPSRAAYAITV